jgi:hypothetical protein
MRWSNVVKRPIPRENENTLDRDIIGTKDSQRMLVIVSNVQFGERNVAKTTEDGTPKKF